MCSSARRWTGLTVAVVAFAAPGVLSSVASATSDPPPTTIPPIDGPAEVGAVEADIAAVITVSVEAPSEHGSLDDDSDGSEPKESRPVGELPADEIVGDVAPDAEVHEGDTGHSNDSEAVGGTRAGHGSDGGEPGGHEPGDEQGGEPGGDEPGGHEPGDESGGHESGGEPGGHEPGDESGGHEPGGESGGGESGGHEPGGESGGHEPGGHESGGEPGGHEPGGEPRGDEPGGHEPGGGQSAPKGNPYRMTFTVVWYTSAGDPILELPPEWRRWFALMADSATGSGKPTSATCTYPAGSDVLTCDYRNAGHASVIDDGMVVPARRTATYTVSVTADPTAPDGWKIVNADDREYSARELCPRGSGGGHDSHDSHAGDGDGSGDPHYCEHTVEMHQLEIVVPPDDEPPSAGNDPPPRIAVRLPIVPIPEPPPTESGGVVQSLSPPAPLPVADNVLPVTGNTVAMTATVGALLVAVGLVLVANTRRPPVRAAAAGPRTANRCRA